jgi:hypothetical protein
MLMLLLQKVSRNDANSVIHNIPCTAIILFKIKIYNT